MRALVVGGGSIGKRHLQNLKTLGVEQLGLVETDAARRSLLTGELAVSGFSSLDEGLSCSPDCVLISTPTHLHVEQALQVVRHGLDVFIEKPLAHKAGRLWELAELAEKKKVVSLVGCNMRFHPGPAKVKELLGANQLGKVLFARIYTGSYLPEWRPGTDYRKNYAAREETGGGCILDCIHEIDLARWYLGDVREVFCVAGHLSSLEIDTEDVAVLVCRHASGAISEVHLDYVQRTYERGCQIVGELGSVFWDFVGGEVRWYDAGSKQWATFPKPDAWQVNQMYVDEITHFLECVHNRGQTVLSIPEAVAVMQVVFAAKTSAQQGAVVAAGRTVLA